jgi:deoxyribodipyrimidine photo-lyase
MIEPTRIQPLSDRPRRDGRFVVYWMQASQRASFNHALEYACAEANTMGLPLVCLFALTDEFPEANLRHYAFMLEGLDETSEHLAERGIQLVVRRGRPDDVAAELAEEASLVVVDRGYLKVEKEWRRSAVGRAPCQVVQVEADVVVPAEVASAKEEYAARTIRPKIRRHLDRYLTPLAETHLKRDSLGIKLEGEDTGDPASLLDKLDIDCNVAPSRRFTGGASEARRRLAEFIDSKLHHYADRANDPSAEGTSLLSPYLHFGQISPVEIALAVNSARGKSRESKDDFLEQLIMRRELAVNFANSNPRYDSYECLPDWARKTLAEHAGDDREYVYSLEDLETADTHDPYWNAAQKEMLATGHMTGYMRMYWGKKILEWTSTPQEAFDRALYLNNKYELDGRDTNGFTGVAWCFGKHDQAWAERPIYGKVRYMSAS